MSIADHLAYSLERKDQEPNKRLANQLVANDDRAGVHEIVDLFDEHRPRRLLMDAMLTLAYIAETKPELIIPHTDFLLSKLKDPIERVGWGSMIALAHITPLVAEKLYKELPKVLDAMERQSVVGRDHGFKVLVKLYQVDEYANDLIHIIVEQISNAPSNQLGQYAERAMTALRANHKKLLIEALEMRREELTNEYHIRRIDKNLKKLYK